MLAWNGFSWTFLSGTVCLQFVHLNLTYQDSAKLHMRQATSWEQPCNAVAGAQTGGLITGVAKYLLEQNSDIQIVVVEPEESAVLSGHGSGRHLLQVLPTKWSWQLNSFVCWVCISHACIMERLQDDEQTGVWFHKEICSILLTQSCNCKRWCVNVTLNIVIYLRTSCCSISAACWDQEVWSRSLRFSKSSFPEQKWTWT